MILCEWKRKSLVLMSVAKGAMSLETPRSRRARQITRIELSLRNEFGASAVISTTCETKLQKMRLAVEWGSVYGTGWGARDELKGAKGGIWLDSLLVSVR